MHVTQAHVFAIFTVNLTLLVTPHNINDSALIDYSSAAGAPALHGHGDKFATHKLPVVSAKWMRDDGIIRLLKSFNSWSRMKGPPISDSNTGVGKSSLHNKVRVVIRYSGTSDSGPSE